MQQIKEEALKALETASDLKALEELRILYLSKKGKVQALMAQMRDLSKEEKPRFGAQVNELKQALEGAFELKKEELEKANLSQQLLADKLDITLDAYEVEGGSLHPLSLVVERIEDAFVGLGYEVAEGPELELDLYNFERANIPANHPARDMQDSFYVNPTHLLRTHTTAIQMRVLEAADKMPIKLICPGKVYRRDDDDATHSHQFMQAEGLVVGENVSLADLKGTLQFMVTSLFGEKAQIRFRPSYFPFTEPSFEVDMSCHICGGCGCSTCKQTGWIEILGSGMVHPDVLEMANIDSKKYSGFAFGIGIERVAMLKYGISDIRDLYNNDIRFLRGFKKF